MAASPIDSRAWRETLSFIDAYDLTAHNAELGSLLVLVDPSRDTPATRNALRRIDEIVAQYRAFHEQYPFPVHRPEALKRGTISTGLRQKADGTELTLSQDDLSLSGLLPGPTGAGKSTAARHIALGARAAGTHVIIVDPKPDAGLRALAASDPDFLIIDRDMRFNLIGRDASLDLAEHIALLVERGADALYVAEDYRQIMNTAYHRAYEEHDDPTMADVIEHIRKLPNKGETYKFRDAQRGAELRHTRFLERYPGLCTSGGAPPSALFDHSLYLPVQTSSIDLFLIAYLLHRLFAWNAWRQRCTS